MKGYQVDLKISDAEKIIDPVKALLVREGYICVENSSLHPSQRPKSLEKYQKEPPGIEKFFFERRADYSVYVDLIYFAEDSVDSEIYINVFMSKISV